MKSEVKRGVLAAVCLVLVVLASGSSEATLLKDAWYNSGDSFTVEGVTYLVNHYDFYATSVILKANDQSVVLKDGQCKASGERKYCLIELDTNLNRNEDDKTGHIKYESGNIYAGLHLTISSLGPTISVSRSFSDSSPELNEEVTVTTTITNSGEMQCDELFYTDTYPAGVVITSGSSGTDYASQALSYRTINILPRETRTVIYTIKLTDYIKVSNMAGIRYFYEGVQTSMNTSSVSLSVVRPYELTAAISPASIELGDETALSIKVLNSVSAIINVKKLEIELPSTLLLKSLPMDLVKKGDKYLWNSSLEGAKSKMFNMLLKPTRSGDHVVRLWLSINDSEGKNFSESKNMTVSVSSKLMEPIISVKEASVSEGGSFRLAVSLKNPNKFVIFRNIKLDVKSDLFPDMSSAVDEMAPGETKTLIVNENMPVPFVDAKKTFDIKVSGSYINNFAESNNFSKTAQLIVTPVSDILLISQSIDKRQVNAGSSVVVVVNVANRNAEPVDVEVHDAFTEGAVIGGGATSALLYFTRSEEKSVYTYNLSIPYGFPSIALNITTYASINSKGYVANKSIGIPVNNSNAVVAPEQPKNDSNQVPVIEAEKPPGFFKKVLNSISGFFRRLLGRE
ncbi:MAG: hypothetical protein V1866_05745 [archaeon]